MMKRICLHLMLSFLLILNSACIHIRSEETKSVQEDPQNQLSLAQASGAKIQYLIYKESQLPLKDFFFHFKRGDYKKAFQEIDLRYRPSTYQDEALSELVEAGFVPVYVRMKNEGNVPIEFDEKSFALDHTDGSAKAFYSEHLPREFKHFSPKAVAANVYNTTVVIVGFAAVMAVLVAAHANGFPDMRGSNTQSSGKPDPIYNDVQQTVKVDYRSYLIHKTKLQPGEEAKGLLFFQIGDSSLKADSKLTFALP